MLLFIQEGNLLEEGKLPRLEGKKTGKNMMVWWNKITIKKCNFFN